MRRNLSLVLRTVAGLTALLTSGLQPALAQDVGTIQASLGGEKRTFYIIGAEGSQGQFSTAFWADLGDGPVVTVAAAASRDAKIELQQGVPGFKGYEGAVLILTFPAPKGSSSAKITTREATLIYMPKHGDYGNWYSVGDGTVELDSADIRASGISTLRGSMSGRLEPMSGSGSVLELTGTFDVEEARAVTVPR